MKTPLSLKTLYIFLSLISPFYKCEHPHVCIYVLFFTKIIRGAWIDNYVFRVLVIFEVCNADLL